MVGSGNLEGVRVLFRFQNKSHFNLKKQIKRKTLGKYSVIYWSKVLLIYNGECARFEGQDDVNERNKIVLIWLLPLVTLQRGEPLLN